MQDKSFAQMRHENSEPHENDLKLRYVSEKYTFYERITSYLKYIQKESKLAKWKLSRRIAHPLRCLKDIYHINNDNAFIQYLNVLQ